MTPDEALDLVAAEWGGVVGLPEVQAIDVLRAELARLRAIEDAAQHLLSVIGGCYCPPPVHDACGPLSRAMAVTPGLSPDPPRG